MTFFYLVVDFWRKRAKEFSHDLAIQQSAAATALRSLFSWSVPDNSALGISSQSFLVLRVLTCCPFPPTSGVSHRFEAFGQRVNRARNRVHIYLTVDQQQNGKGQRSTRHGIRPASTGINQNNYYQKLERLLQSSKLVTPNVIFPMPRML